MQLIWTRETESLQPNIRKNLDFRENMLDACEQSGEMQSNCGTGG